MPLAMPPPSEPFRGCRQFPGKRRFVTKRAAIEYAKAIHRHSRVWKKRSKPFLPLTWYPCPSCGDYHLTTKKGKRS